jgi:hypothetical protein
MEPNTNWELIANVLQQRVAQMVANYEGQLAVLQAQIQQMQEIAKSGAVQSGVTEGNIDVVEESSDTP